jgi:putative membrane protein
MFDWIMDGPTTPQFWIGVTALVHFIFMYVEMRKWVWLSQRVAGLSEAEAEATKVIGFNQGLYNGFFAVGLMAALAGSTAEVPVFGQMTPEHAAAVAVFVLVCVVVAGTAGAISLKRWPFLVAQSGPAIVALVLM